VFTGLIEEVGQVRRIRRQGQFQRLELSARRVLEGTRIGDSINIHGACQTVVEISAGSFAVESVEETLERTTLGELRPGAPVNLERSLRLQDRLGGHLLLGHVDGVGRISELEQRHREWLLSVEPPPELLRYIAFKGAIAIDGISLTVARVESGAFTVDVIPHTFDHTALAHCRRGDRVNLEVDILARYVERLLSAGGSAGSAGLTLEKLREMGF